MDINTNTPATSLAFDSTGAPGICYFSDYVLSYAFLVNGQWNTVMVYRSASDEWQYCSLAFDPKSDTPCISFRGVSSTSGELKFAYMNNGQWIIETVDSSEVLHHGMGYYPSLAFNPKTDAPSISYSNYPYGALKFASRDPSTGQWQTETVDLSGIYTLTGDWTSLAFDEFGVPSISYYGGYKAALKHATQVYGKWYATTVDDGGGVGEIGLYTSIKIDPKTDTACIGYIVYPNDNDHGNITVEFAYIA